MVSQMIQPIVAFMVLCSIAIHGFSLGKRFHSVSRTRSRRDKAGSHTVAPDWTNQARMVTRAEDIVINQDLEIGDGGREGVPLEKTSTRTLNESEDGQKDAMTASEEGIPASIVPQRDQDDDCRNQFPPDGKHNQTREWIEGDQRVVERNLGGPGDDVRSLLSFSHSY